MALLNDYGLVIIDYLRRLFACAAGGQHEEHSALRSPVRDVVNKNSTEPQAAQRRCIRGCGVS